MEKIKVFMFFLEIVLCVFVWFIFDFWVVIVIAIVFSIIMHFLSYFDTIKTLRFGEWKNAVIVNKEKIKRHNDSGPTESDHCYYFRIELEDGTYIDGKRHIDDFTERLREERKIRILVYEDDFLFDDEVKNCMKVKFLKKYTKRFESEFKDEKKS